MSRPPVRREGIGRFGLEEVMMPSKSSSAPAAQLHTLATGLVFGESPRWGRDGCLWFADWGTQQIVAVDADGKGDDLHRLAA
jgi:sugar lactone lactonase YvrE